MRAYPHIITYEQNDDLKDKFVLGIRDRTLSDRLKSSDHYETWSFTDLLTKAQRIHGSALIVHQAYGGKALGSDSINSIADISKHQTLPTIQALHAPTTRKPIKCFHCQKEGHVIRECFAYQRTKDMGSGNQPTPQNRQVFTPRPGRGHGRGGFRPANRPLQNYFKKMNQGPRYNRQPRGQPARPNAFQGRGINSLQEKEQDETDPDDPFLSLENSQSPSPKDQPGN